MYFFLSMLSASETMYTLIIIPKMLCNLTGLSQPISLAGCATQMFFITLAINNCFLLTAMGHDCYVAICNPLSILVILVPMGLVFISYILIISTTLKIASAKGQKKAFATCASHLTVVTVHYGCASIVYPKPRSENTEDQGQLISVTSTIITPLVNPVVYTPRNKEVKDALLRATGRKLS
uniref:G-protein coupled receptors family 1 profile domain-containing protein n=1 Tax=Monodon monoceros TaxID=40151 RepID=A0A8C6B585_MONMO